MALGLVLLCLGLRLVSELYRVAEEAQVVRSALNVTAPRRADPGILRWLDDAPTPRRMDDLPREEITSDYLLAMEELAYAHLTGDASGLASYFAQGALSDARLATSSPSRAHLASWDHRLELQFYAPDGATVAFSDTHLYAQGLEAGNDLRDVRIAERELQTVMTLDEGNWRVRHWRVLSDERYDGETGGTEGLEARLARMRGVNYIARGAPFEFLWPLFDRAEVAADFTLIASLGLDTVRFFIPYPMPEGVLEHLPEMLDLAETHGLELMPTLLDNYTVYRLQDLPGVMRYLELLAPFLAHEAVLAVDIKNEADRDFETAGAERVRSFLAFVTARTRDLTHKPVTVGLISPDPVLSEALDFVTLHHYLPPESLPPRVEAARATGRPVLLQEFGFHTQRLKLPDPHTEAEQAWYYERMLEVAAGEGIGWMFWTLHDLPTGPMPGGRTVERHLGVFGADGRPKETVAVLGGASVGPPSLWDRVAKILPFLAPVALLLLPLLAVLNLRAARRRARSRRLRSSS